MSNILSKKIKLKNFQYTGQVGKILFLNYIIKYQLFNAIKLQIKNRR